ncbi:uncharacterized protein LOC120922015 [Rana temporaria]|uniref:uncharacterized protein LOC120922015 n=1 Tax=Rana temporaria TaxID=8407 RepID=UPI001AAD1147|nr:uncharacterized protein LOC120922015 [Rana temporaria]
MAAPTLRFALLLALLIQDTGAECVYSWNSSGSSAIVLCSSCAGICYEYDGCYCSNGFDVCLPDGNVTCNVNDLSYCCPSGLYYNQTSPCCTETSICYGGCATDEVCDMGVCVCNSSIYQDKTLTDFHPAVSCDYEAMTGSASQCLLSSLGYDFTSIHLRNSSEICIYPYPNIANGQRVLSVQVYPAPGWCGSTVTVRMDHIHSIILQLTSRPTPTDPQMSPEEGSRLFLTNTIYIGAPVNSNVTVNPISFNITCPLLTGTYPLAQ